MKPSGPIQLGLGPSTKFVFNYSADDAGLSHRVNIMVALYSSGARTE